MCVGVCWLTRISALALSAVRSPSARAIGLHLVAFFVRGTGPAPLGVFDHRARRHSRSWHHANEHFNGEVGSCPGASGISIGEAWFAGAHHEGGTHVCAVHPFLERGIVPCSHFRPWHRAIGHIGQVGGFSASGLSIGYIRPIRASPVVHQDVHAAHSP